MEETKRDVVQTGGLLDVVLEAHHPGQSLSPVAMASQVVAGAAADGKLATVGDGQEGAGVEVVVVVVVEEVEVEVGVGVVLEDHPCLVETNSRLPP
ncbi:hypothetical protein Hamer_G000185 [Homarus americanus]|uniref:Uncharacterized protein n=1 Tax=Homarus americanus TaxID=6706 RepID=A0A8J5TTU4_HOMAM|nr:hypothetical protein Hamer_G000185 [Homarus americanus]